MEKKLLFSVLFCSLQLACFSKNGPVAPSFTPTNVLQCDAPPPDSFRVTGYGYNFVTLAWVPISVGDDHYLTIFKKNETNGWDSLYAITLYNATTYTLNNLQPQKEHRVEIRSLCNDGEPGTVSSIVYPNIIYILELTTGGRKPVDPKEVLPECSRVAYKSHKWLGFRLTKNDNSKTEPRLFEFIEKNDTDIKGSIRIVGEDQYILVAANDNDVWPGQLFSSVYTNFLQFRVGEILNQSILNVFGFVNADFDFDFTSVALCPDPTNPIVSPYKFEFLVADQVEENCPNCPNPIDPTSEKSAGNGQNWVVGSKIESIKAQSPFSNFLNIFFPQTGFVGGLKHFELHDINGKIHFSEKIDVQEPKLALPFGNLPKGFYILRIEANEGFQSLRLIKI